MAADAAQLTFPQLLRDVTPELRPVCSALRKLIQKADPDFVEIIWPRQRIASYGVGPKKMSEHYAYIAPQKSHVNLGLYRGTSLADPDGLLEGTGKQLRHIKLKSVSVATSAAVKQLLDCAIAERQEALA